MPYEDPIKSEDLEHWSHEDREKSSPQNRKQPEEVLEIKPKKLTG